MAREYFISTAIMSFTTLDYFLALLSLSEFDRTYQRYTAVFNWCYTNLLDPVLLSSATEINKKFWKELICLLSLHYLTMLYDNDSNKTYR
jgi:hypothetical protein